MIQRVLTIFALCGVVALNACTRNTETSAAASPQAGAPAAAAAAQASTTATAAPEPPQAAIIVPPKPKAGAPHGPGFDMPLLDLGGYAPTRPMPILTDAHIFTADHPEVASYIPCYCGCGNMGHKNNADCFVGARDKEGRVTEWVPHGAACAVCIDIAVESMRMRNSGASVTAIRKQIQDEYRPHFPSTETPTPAPPPGR